MLRTIIFAIAAMAGSLTAEAAIASSTGRCGGTGDDHTKTLTCPAGQHIVAMTARTGIVTDQVGIRCGKVNADGTTASIGSWKTGGPGGGTHQAFAECPLGHAARKLWIHSGTYLDSINYVGCSRRETSGDFRSVTPIKSLSNQALAGYCEFICPPGEALYQLTLKYGSVVDSITGGCRK